MSYQLWFQKHGEKHRNILNKLEHLSDDELIHYFRFDNMVKSEPDFCPLYKDNKRCHDNLALNCYFCACPNFRFDDQGFEEIGKQKLFSFCSIDSKDGDQYKSEDSIHQNCAGCFVPHSEAYIKKHFTRNWFEAMQNVTQVC